MIDEAEDNGEEAPECNVCLVPFGVSETTGAVKSSINDV